MTPNAESDQASRACAKTIWKEKEKGSWQVNYQKRSETKARELAKRPKGGPHFFSWEPSRFKQDDAWVTKGPWPPGTKASFVLPVDCRPTENLLDIMVVNMGADPIQANKLSIRNVEISKKLLRAVSKRGLWMPKIPRWLTLSRP
jgi:hypothetical protein